MTIDHMRNQSKPVDTISPVVQLWILRILVPLGGHRELIGTHGFNNLAIAELFNLIVDADSSDFEYSQKEATTKLRKLHREAELKSHEKNAPLFLQENVRKLADLVGLSNNDSRILEFAVLIKNEPLLDEAADCLKELSTEKVFRVLSSILDLPESEIRLALNHQGLLAKSGLLTIDRNYSRSLNNKLDVLSNNFAGEMESPNAEPMCLLRDIVALSSPAELEIRDYERLGHSLLVLRTYLKNAQGTGRKGVNVFLHGAPGTGKTQLAKVLAQELDCQLFEVASEDNDGDPINGERRLSAYRAAQSFFTGQRSMILFDESEDVFNDGDIFSGRKSTAQTRKAWINKTLEENTVPTIWLSNSVRCLDPAFIRRFDMIVEISIPTKSQREQIIKGISADLLDTVSIARIARSEELAPAVVSKAVSVISTIQDQLGEEGTSKAIELLINSTLEAQGHAEILKHHPNRVPEIYDPSFINADFDLAQVAEGLKQSKSGRLCLYGVPGTGKTAYGRWLAEQLDVPLIVKRASDLISPWVGGSEQNVAQAFKQAEREGAVLLIDEVDSFLQDRRKSKNSWETTLVNEMLTQMESFSGIFIASTNLMDGLDQAVLRRFDLKVKFNFLEATQVSGLFKRYCIQMKLEKPQPSELTEVLRMRNLTPGDFATVIRQSRFRPILSCGALIAALQQECAMKEGAKPAMGFLH